MASGLTAVRSTFASMKSVKALRTFLLFLYAAVFAICLEEVPLLAQIAVAAPLAANNELDLCLIDAPSTTSHSDSSSHAAEDVRRRAVTYKLVLDFGKSSAKSDVGQEGNNASESEEAAAESVNVRRFSQGGIRTTERIGLTSRSSTALSAVSCVFRPNAILLVMGGGETQQGDTTRTNPEAEHHPSEDRATEGLGEHSSSSSSSSASTEKHIVTISTTQSVFLSGAGIVIAGLNVGAWHNGGQNGAVATNDNANAPSRLSHHHRSAGTRSSIIFKINIHGNVFLRGSRGVSLAGGLPPYSSIQVRGNKFFVADDGSSWSINRELLSVIFSETVGMSAAPTTAEHARWSSAPIFVTSDAEAVVRYYLRSVATTEARVATNKKPTVPQSQHSMTHLGA